MADEKPDKTWGERWEEIKETIRVLRHGRPEEGAEVLTGAIPPRLDATPAIKKAKTRLQQMDEQTSEKNNQ
jgi:hypothetical protein